MKAEFRSVEQNRARCKKHYWKNPEKHRARCLANKWKARPTVVPRPESCESCGGKVTLCWDHDHETGTHRGWLCGNCNVALGMLKEDRARIKGLLTYMDRVEGRRFGQPHFGHP